MKVNNINDIIRDYYKCDVNGGISVPVFSFVKNVVRLLVVFQIGCNVEICKE